ncbi:Homeotic protein proboscipedia [Frankliniella fusca]|uniref:Homeotic protein proboscipedia n=1 Tax=Frankliniella fusca TaxID=407009 RepID=A0AAE1L5F5_9NEOP|nr:Homeotic protein proboscipedia [Frankliniella fusca]
MDPCVPRFQASGMPHQPAPRPHQDFRLAGTAGAHFRSGKQPQQPQQQPQPLAGSPGGADPAACYSPVGGQQAAAYPQQYPQRFGYPPADTAYTRQQQLQHRLNGAPAPVPGTRPHHKTTAYPQAGSYHAGYSSYNGGGGGGGGGGLGAYDQYQANPFARAGGGAAAGGGAGGVAVGGAVTGPPAAGPAALNGHHNYHQQQQAAASCFPDQDAASGGGGGGYYPGYQYPDQQMQQQQQQQVQHDQAVGYYPSEGGMQPAQAQQCGGYEYSKQQGYYEYPEQFPGVAAAACVLTPPSSSGDVCSPYQFFEHQGQQATSAGPAGATHGHQDHLHHDNSNSSSDFNFLSNLANDFAPEYYQLG